MNKKNYKILTGNTKSIFSLPKILNIFNKIKKRKTKFN